MNPRLFRAIVGLAASALAGGCESAGDPPVAEWRAAPVARVAAAAAPRQDGVPLSRSERGGPAEVISGTGRFIGANPTRNDRDPPKGEEDGVTLNLVNLPIAQAAKIVLGDIVGVDYVVDPKLDGKVTVHTAHPVTKSAAVELFQSAVRVSGATIVDSGGLYQIVPLDQASAFGAAIANDSSNGASQRIGEGAKMVQLRYVSASEMKRVLEPIAPHGGVVRADDARNTLTLSGTQQEIATLEDAVAMFDIDTMRGMSFAVIPVKSSDPDALTEDLRNVFGSEKDGPMNGMIRFVGNKRLSAILAISPQQEYLARARAWVARLDARAQSNEKQFFSYLVQNRPAKELVQVLAAMFGADTGNGKGNNVAPRHTQTTMNSGSSGAGGVGSAGLAPTSPLGALSNGGMGGNGLSGLGAQGAAAGSLASSAGSGYGTTGAGSESSMNGANGAPQAVALGEDSRFKVAVDEAKNAVVTMSTPDDYKRLLHVMEALDVLPNQVFIEATIAEVSLNDDLQFGVRWFLNQKHANSFAFSSAGVTDKDGITIGPDLAGVFPGFSYMLKAANAQVTLHALNELTHVNVLSTPSLTVLDNRQAMLQVGDQIPVPTTTSNISFSATSTTYLDTGVILAITPHINESGRVMLELEQQVSNALPDATSTVGPTIQQRKVKTQVVVNDGEALTLGGLIQDRRTRDATQIPVLGDLPLLGLAFKNKSDSIGKTELLIMITPHVVRSTNEAREITDEFKRKLLQISAETKTRPHDIEQSTRRILLDQ